MSQHHIEDLIQSFLSKNNKTVLYKEQMVIEKWNKIMGEFIAAQTKSIYIRDGIIYLFLKSAALRFELMGMRSEVIKKLNKEAGMEVVKDIIIR